MLIEVEDEHLEMPIPPLTMQLLVENAVKHNVISTSNPLKVNVSVVENELRVLNNMTETPVQTASHGVGLDNIKKRYAYFTKEEIRIVDDDYFEVRLPILSYESNILDQPLFD